MMQGEKEERREEEQMYPSTHSGQKWVDRVLVPTWGVDEKTLDWVLLRPAPQNVAEKKEGAVGASAHRKPLAAELKHGRHVAPGRAGSGTLKQKRDWSVGDTYQRRPFETYRGTRDGEGKRAESVPEPLIRVLGLRQNSG